jgi:hypothetical protein
MGGGMGMAEPTDGERLAGMSVSLENLEKSFGELRADVREVLRNCPRCQSEIATHTAEIKGLTDRVRAAECQIGLLWGRLWQVALGAAASGGIIGVVVSYLMKR